VEKNSPFLDGVDEASWQAFSLKFIQYRTKGGRKSTRDLFSPSVMNYYGSQIANIWLMNDIDLYYAVNKINQPNLEPLNVLISSLSMKPSKIYVKKLVQEYISLFITILANFPIIRFQCAPYAVVKQFFKKLQPHSLAQDMLNMEINDINLAIQELHQKLKTKDIQEFENTRNLIKHDVSETSSTSTALKIKCANCQHSTKPENSLLHKIWNCLDIDFCYRCNLKHLALGPHCKFKDTKVFNYENYLKKKKDENPEKTYQKKVNVTTEVVKPAESNELSIQILQELKLLNKSISEVSKRKLETKNIIIDSGCNSTCINDALHSDIPIVYNRMDQPKDSVEVADGQAANVSGTGEVLNHSIS